MATKEYDVIVIGAGSTGENVADRVVPIDGLWHAVPTRLVKAKSGYVLIRKVAVYAI
jgi:hypothetical protein